MSSKIVRASETWNIHTHHTHHWPWLFFSSSIPTFSININNVNCPLPHQVFQVGDACWPFALVFFALHLQSSAHLSPTQISFPLPTASIVMQPPAIQYHLFSPWNLRPTPNSVWPLMVAQMTQRMPVFQPPECSCPYLPMMATQLGAVSSMSSPRD